ncbi:MAG: dihydroorotase [Oscillospiraceae bacterium]
MELLIKNGRVFDGARLTEADILIQNGVVKEVAKGLQSQTAEIVEAAGCIASPGFCDLHVHLREPGFPEKETIATGTAAGAAGGFTTLCCMPNLSPVPDSLHSLQPQLAAIEKDALVQVLPYGALTVKEKGECIADIEVLGSFVCGFSDDGRGVQREEMMRRAMNMVAAQNSFVAAHCEVEGLLPENFVTVQENSAFAKKHGFAGVSNQSEWAEVERNIALVKETGCPLHICHTSAAESFALVRAAKQQGLPVTCEVTPHNLLLSCDDIAEDDGRFKMNPPLRTARDKKAAIEALLDGTASAVATDHAPHTAAQKAGGFAKSMNGVVGLETAFASLYTHLVLPGVIGLEQLLALLGAAPRGILGLPQPAIRPGEKADLVLLNLVEGRLVNPEDFKTKGRATPFAGWRLKGWPVLTLYGGNIVYRR